MDSGIYLIRNLITGRCYVGGSCNRKRRYLDHKRSLRNGVHENRLLQAAWDIDGPSVFEFTDLEDCEVAALKEREQFWIDKLLLISGPERLYNINLVAQGPINVGRQVKLGTKQTEATRAKIRAYRLENPQPHIGAKGEANHMHGVFGAANKCSVPFHVIDPQGNHHIGVGLSEFCRQHGISAGNLCWVIKGKAKQTKGWTAPKAA